MYWIFISGLMLIFGLWITWNIFRTLRCPLGIFTIVWNGLFLLHNLHLVEYTGISPESGLIIMGSYMVFLMGSILGYSIKLKGEFGHIKEDELNRPIPLKSLEFNVVNIDEVNTVNKAIRFSLFFSNLGIILWLFQIVSRFGLKTLLNSSMYLNRVMISEHSNSFINYLINVFSLGGSLLIGILVARGYGFKKSYIMIFLPTTTVALFTGQRYMTIICILNFIAPLLVLGTGSGLEKVKSIKMKKMIVPVIILVLFFVFVGNKRGSFEEFSVNTKLNNVVLSKTYTYLTGSFAAFSEQLRVWDGSLMLGANTFLPLFKLTNSFGITKYDDSMLTMIDTGRPFTNIPMPFNVYSYLWDIIFDWGYIGVFLLPLILGLASSYYWRICSVSKIISYRDIILSFTIVFLMYSFVSSITSFSTVWYAYIYALLSLKLFKKKN
ncbi:hypothetical protein BSK66_26525 [Paenibacillus odorifer]|nr:hypothetical protein C171_21484 [Paenibacillus sp. FSL H8-237]OME49772.1 hypothetical protein BSK66_26525 [Paenibacillus odorifer]